MYWRIGVSLKRGKINSLVEHLIDCILGSLKVFRFFLLDPFLNRVEVIKTAGDLLSMLFGPGEVVREDRRVDTT